MTRPLHPPPGTSPSDAELIARVLAGDREAYAGLVERYQESLYRYAYGMLRDPDLTADLVQESFVSAYASLASCRDRDNFRAWIFRILRNRCTDHARSPAARSDSIDHHELRLFARDAPADDVENAEIRRAVESALARLPENQREAFLLRHVENLSYEEMSELLETGVSALKMRVMRARTVLQEALREAGIAGSDGM
jgi:RNA polymerase sigma-70 factor, ECF subfamily